MRRALLICAILAGASLATGTHAQATTELCPATATLLHPLDAVAPATEATTFSYDLYSLSPETVSGTLAVQTDDGWYEVPFGPVALVEHDEKYSIEYTNFIRRNYYSAPLYVRFPKAVDTKYQFVSKITTNDTMFAWPTTKDLRCEWAGAPLDLPRAHPTKRDLFELPTHPALLAPPPSASSIPVAVRLAELNALSRATHRRRTADIDARYADPRPPQERPDARHRRAYSGYLPETNEHDPDLRPTTFHRPYLSQR